MVDSDRIELGQSSKKGNSADWRCDLCNRLICDSYCLKISDRSYHADCLQCAVCGIHLTKSCFIREETLYCPQHFFRRFGGTCTGCHLGIPPTDTVRRCLGNVYHIHCFCCEVCDREFVTGDQYYILDDLRLICKTDFQCKVSEADVKRPRTTIGSNQLDTLKAAYNKSSKPSRHVREKLSRDTGLDMRVVQVWFQNRRAKEKRLKKDAGRQRGTWTQARSSNRSDVYVTSVFPKDTSRNDLYLHDGYNNNNINSGVTGISYTDFC